MENRKTGNLNQKKTNFERMFTGIIEATGTIKEVVSNGGNKTFWITSSLSSTFKPDQSVAHNGVCLTVESVEDQRHKVTAVAETLLKTNFNEYKMGDNINLERAMILGSRVDGHLVQGHVDTTGTCVLIEETEGSWQYRVRFPKKYAGLIIEKGSICLNGISLTVFDLLRDEFSVAIIPFTYNHTNIGALKTGHTVNLEFDFFGKYINRLAETRDLVRTDQT